MPVKWNIVFYRALLCISILVFINHFLEVFSFRYDLAGLEHYFLYLILKSGTGELYGDPEVFPFLVSQYPPLYLLIVKGIASCINLFVHDMVRSAYVGGRLLNLAMILVTCRMIYMFFSRYVTQNTRMAMIPALLVFSVFMSHVYSVRPDSLKLLLLVSMYIMAWRFFKDRSRSMLWMSVLGVMAILTKQDAAIHIGLLGMLIWVRMDFKTAFRFVFPVSAISLGLLWAVCGFSIEHFIKNFILGISQGINGDWVRVAIKWNILAFSAQITLVAGAIVWSFSGPKRERATAVLLLVLFLITLLTVFKWGSNFNYFTEFQLLIICWYSFLWMSERNRFRDAIFIICVGLLFANNYTSRNTRIFHFFTERDALYEYRSNRATSFEILQTMEIEQMTKVIVFSPSLALHLNRETILGTTANEYPELFLPHLQSMVSSLPERNYSYRFDCQMDALDEILFITPNKADEQHREAFYYMFRDGPALSLIPILEDNGFNFYSLSCQ